MKRGIAALLTLWSVSACASTPADVPSAVVEKFSTTFKNMKFTAIKPSELPGIYEVYTGGKIIYYAAAHDILVFGELYSSGGESLTAKKLERFTAVKAVAIDRGAALAVGQGTHELIAFLNPDCGYCSQALAWLEQQNYANTQLLVYFLQMEPRSSAYARALQAVCAPPELRREAMRQVFQRGPEASTQHILSCADGEATLAAQAKVAEEMGVAATPVFVVKGETVMGFRPDRLAALLQLTEIN